MKPPPLHSTTARQIIRRAVKKGRGWAFTPHDFADLGDPRSTGMALTRLVREGKIRRVARGVYDIPHPHPVLGQAGATVDSVVAAVARKKNLRVIPSAAVAANQLGLSTQVPSQMIYHTDGAAAGIKLGKLEIVFRRNSGRLLSLAGRTSGLVSQGLRDLGNGRVTPAHIDHLRATLPASAKRELARDITMVPAWMRPHIEQILRDHE